MNQPYKGDVHWCMTILVVRGQSQIHKTHLIFEEGVPLAVLEWIDVPGGLSPNIVVPLEPRRLHAPMLGSTDQLYTYELPIEYPKGMS